MIEIISGVIGLVVGVLSGFYFERRATKEAVAHATWLQQQLDEVQSQLRFVKESVYSIGSRHRVTGPALATVSELSDSVFQWVRGHQDATGRVLRSRLQSVFVAEGHSPTTVEEAILALINAGRLGLTTDEQRVQVR